MSNNPNQFGNGGGAAETGWESVADMAESAPKIIVEDHFGGEAKRVKTYDENLNEIKAEEFNEQEDRLNYYREHPEKFGQILGKDAGDIQERTEWYLAKPEAERDEILQHEVQAYYEKKAAEKNKGAEGIPEVAEEVGRAAVEAAESSPVYQIPKGEGLEVWNDPAYRKQMNEYSKEMQEKRNELIDMDKARQLQEEEAARQRATYEQQVAEEQRMGEQWQAALAERKGLEDVAKSGERRELGAEDVEQINETIEDWEKSGAEGLKKLKQEAEKYLAEMAAADLSRYSNEDLEGIARYIEQSRRIIEIVNGKLAGEGAPEGDEPAGEGDASGEEAGDGGVSVPVEEEGGVSVRVTPGETISGGAEDGDGEESEPGEESEAESGEAEEKGAEKDERAEESRAEKKDDPRKLLPEYSHSDWEKVCRSFELNEVRGVYDILEQFMDGSRERALDIVMNEWLDSGRVMGAVVILDRKGRI